MIHFSFYPIAESYALIAVIALALAALLAIGPAAARLTRPRRWTLLLLRLGIFLLLILAMLRPTIVYTQTQKQAATAVTLHDTSTSMTVGDSIGGRTRYEAMRRAVSDAAGPLARLADDFELKAYGFDAETHPLPVAEGRVELPEKPTGTQTAIGAALDDVMRQEAGKRLLGIILLSDGAQKALAPRDLAPQTAAARLKNFGVPLYTVSFGQARGLGQAKDVAVRDLVVNSSVFVNNELDVTGQIRVDGLVNRQIVVRVLFETEPAKMEVVAEEKVQATSDGQLLPIQMQFVPREPGERKLTLEAVAQDGELVTTNNQLSTFVHVLKGGLRVLYVEGTFRPETKYLRRALDASPDVKVDYLHIDAQHPETQPGDFLDRFKPGAYDVYILGDIDASAFAQAGAGAPRYPALNELAEAVNRGAGLIMLGGYHSFGPGGYAETPLAAVLPVGMDRFERQAFDAPPRDDVQLPGPLRFLPTQFGRTHPALMLAATPEASEALWRELPPLRGANRFKAMAPGAIALADDGRGQPLLVFHQYGGGRVLALAIDTTWNWWMGTPEKDFIAQHKRFWRQIVLWLAKRDLAGQSQVWVRLDRRRFAPNERVDFRMGAIAPDGQPIADALFDVQAVLPDGTRRALRGVRQGDQWIAALRETQQPGDYAIEVSATSDGRPIGSTRARLLVFEQNLELDNPAADTAAMDSLATLTGGQSVAPEQLSELIEHLLENTRSLEVQQETKRSLWDRWPFFLALVALMTVEWFLRKRWGLV